MATASPPSSTSYQTEKNLASLIAGDTNSALSTVDTLSSLKLLRDLAGSSTDDRDKSSIQQCIDTETQFLRTALFALQKTPALSAKFGTGLGAALSLANVLREKHTMRSYDAIISRSLDEAGALTGLETPDKRADRLNETRVLQRASGSNG